MILSLVSRRALLTIAATLPLARLASAQSDLLPTERGARAVAAQFLANSGIDVEPGKTTGLAVDGLVHVNGRWVFMPKPWTVVKAE